MDLLQPFAAIVLVMALLGAALFLLRRRGAASFHLPGNLAGKNGPRQLEVIERVALGPGHALHLVRMGDRRVLIATGPASCQVLETRQGLETRQVFEQ